MEKHTIIINVSGEDHLLKGSIEQLCKAQLIFKIKLDKMIRELKEKELKEAQFLHDKAKVL